MTGDSAALRESTRWILEAYETAFAVEVFDSELFARVRALLPAAVTPSDQDAPSDREAVFRLTTDGDGVFRVHQAANEVLASRDLELALWMLGGMANEYIAFRARTGVFVRGAAVLYEQRAIMLVGPVLSGKTTLAAALVRSGASTWADEYVILDASGRVEPFSAVGSSLLEEVGPSRRAAPLGLLVVTSYRPAASWGPTEGTPGDAMLELLARAIPAQDRSSLTMSVVRQAVDGAMMLTGERGEAADAAPPILQAADAAFASRPLFS